MSGNGVRVEPLGSLTQLRVEPSRTNTETPPVGLTAISCPRAPALVPKGSSCLVRCPVPL